LVSFEPAGETYDACLVLDSRRWLALCAALTLIIALPAAADAKRPKPNRAGHKATKKVKAPRADWDRDGLNNRYERRAGTNPRKADSNRNGRSDGLEDRDRDRVGNRTEQLARTHPRRRDSNRNGVPDGREDHDHDGLANRGESLMSMHPRRADTDGDGISDGDEHAGVVAAKTATTLTIALAAGGTLVAAVTEETDVICRSPAGGAGEEGSEPGAGEDPGEGEEVGSEDPGADPEADPDDPTGEGEDPEDPGEDPEDEGFGLRTARLGQAGATEAIPCLRVGRFIYQADIEDTGSGLVFTALDLLRPAAA